MTKSIYYNYNNILSRNAMLNFILTNRGGGKTYGFKEKAINNFLKKGKQFIYVRRYKSEFNKIITFFDKIKEKYPNHTFKCTKHFAYIDDKIAGYFIPLSTANNEKSTEYPNVTLICYDEFIINKKNQRYISDEPFLFDGLIETVVRMRDDVTVLCTANNVTLTNPYFEYWGIYPDFEDDIRTYDIGGEKVCVEIRANKDFIEEKIKTRWGKLSTKTQYGKHSLYNETLYDDSSFIFDKRPQKSIFLFSIILNGSELGVWSNGEKYYVDKKIIATTKLRYVLQKDDMSPDYRMVQKVNSSPLIYGLKKSFTNGKVFYKDKYVKSQMYDIFKFIGIR